MERPSLAFRNLVFKQMDELKKGGISNFADNSELQVRFLPKWKESKDISPSVTGLDLFPLTKMKGTSPAQSHPLVG